jgi:hypothetical protein
MGIADFSSAIQEENKSSCNQLKININKYAGIIGKIKNSD